MKLKIGIWALVILFCLSLGFLEKENLEIIWREYSSSYRHFEGHGLKCQRPLIGGKVAEIDSEAAAVAEIQLCHYENDKRINILAKNLLKHPENKFFLFYLAEQISYSHETVIDPQIIQTLADKLIELEPDNTNYHYLKAYSLLMDGTGKNIAPILEEIEYANSCANYNFPYDEYKQRAIDIANRAKLSQVLVKKLSRSPNDSSFTYDINENLIRRAHLAFINGDYDMGIHIDDALSEMLRRQILEGDPKTICLMNLRQMSSMFSFGFWDMPQGLELQTVTLSKERAQKNRFELCALILRSKEKLNEQIHREENGETMLAVSVATHSGKMFIAFLLAWIILFVASIMRGFGEKSKVGFGSIVLFLTFCVYYFLITQGSALWELLQDFGCHHLTYMDFFFPFHIGIIGGLPIVLLFLFTILILWIANLTRPKKGMFSKFWCIRILVSLVIGGILVNLRWLTLVIGDDLMLIFRISIVAIWILIMFGWWLSRNRIFWLILVTTFLGGLTILAGGYRYIEYLPMILFVIIVPLIVTHGNSDKRHLIKVLFGVFSREPGVAEIRSKCLRLMGPFIVGYYLLFILLTPSLVKSINLYSKQYPAYSYKFSLPEANKATYEQILKQMLERFDEEKLHKWEIYKLISLVTPEDLPVVLKKLKNREFADRWEGMPSLRRGDGIEEETKLNDQDLILMMRLCGRDVVNIITDFMDEPESERALVARARLGDKSIKAKLKELLQDRMLKGDDFEEKTSYKSYLEVPLKMSEILSALACISEPEEAEKQFLDYIHKQRIRDLIEDREFFNSVSLLPTEEGHNVIKAYLTKANELQTLIGENTSASAFRGSINWHIWHRALFPLRELLVVYGDREIAEAVFKIMLLSANVGDVFQSWHISDYFTSESAELLKKGLLSNEENLRAWCVWQLNRIGYKWSEEELNKLLTDESWKVRANVVLAGGKKATVLARKEQNNFVRFVSKIKSQ